MKDAKPFMDQSDLKKTTNLKFRLFGSFEVTSGGLSIEGLHRRKADRLLAYLVLHAGQWVDKLTIASLFWDSEAVYDTEQNLRQSLSYLRHTMGDSANCLESRPKALRIQIKTIQADTLILEEACSGRNCEQLIKSLQATEGIDDCLLAGWSDSWIIPFRTKYTDRLIKAQMQVVKAQMQTNIQRNDQSNAENPINESRRTITEQAVPEINNPARHIEPIGGAVLLDSPYYIERESDAMLMQAIKCQDSVILIKGARQTGKSSLLARGLQFARTEGMMVFEVDFELFTENDIKDRETFYLRLIALLAEQSEQELVPNRDWKPHLGASGNLEGFLRRQILKLTSESILWAIDGVDRLFAVSHYNEFFALLRGIHTKHATEPHLGWNRLTTVISSATEAHLYIQDLNQSPFNVGTRISLQDFNDAECEDLYRRSSSPLSSAEEWAELRRLLGGHPYLLMRGLFEIKSRKLQIDTFLPFILRSDGPFRDHLERMLKFIAADSNLRESIIAVLRGDECSESSFYRLRSAGVLIGQTPQTAKPRCGLYGEFLGKHLK